MRLAFSNIAWPAENDVEVCDALALADVGIEIAPTRLWPDWDVTTSDATEASIRYRRRGLTLSSLQAILFGRPDLQMFGPPDVRKALVDHLVRVADLAAAMGVVPMVFGAPRNRDASGLCCDEAVALATQLLSEVAVACTRRSVFLGFEPNPTTYHCNFVTNSTEAAGLVRGVASPGLRLHLDTAAMFLAGEDPERAIEAHADILGHVHISEPHLGGFEVPVVNHRQVACSLRRINWSGWIVVEMRARPHSVAAVRTALEYVRSIYLD